MCMQCVAAAMGSTATATGTRSYLAARHFAWVTPQRLRRITVALLGSAAIASSLVASGSTTPTARVADSTHVQQTQAR